MPTITAQSIIDKAEIILQDTTNVRWEVSELLGWLNDGQREVATLRPDATNKTVSVTMVAGTRQSLPDESARLVRVQRNMGANGATPGEAVRPTSMQLMDLHRPNWHTDSPATVVKHYMHDSRTPDVYYVWPPSTGTTQVEVVYQTQPAIVTNAANTISIGDEYANALIDYIIYRAYAKDIENPQNGALARQAYEAFRTVIVGKTEGDASTAG